MKRATAGHLLIPAGALGAVLAAGPLGARAHLQDWAAGIALVAGITLSLTAGNPWIAYTRRWTPILLQVSVVGLGFGMDLGVVARVGLHGIGYTLAGIALAFAIGTLLARAMGIPRDVGLLITVGTAICGGSAIAAVAPVIRAREEDVSVSLGTVFLLNAIGLLLFPILGHAFALDEHRFGLWAALAIHDTSSVVGAATQFGKLALVTATTVKLARALWIVPLTLVIGAVRARDAAPGASGARRPWFIAGFLAAAALVTFVPATAEVGHALFLGARQALVLTLFFIGANLSVASLRAVGVRPLLHGVLLWFAVASLSLVAILTGIVN